MVLVVGVDDKMHTIYFTHLSPEALVHSGHPLLLIRKMFDRMYSYTGHSSIPPENLLKALLLQALYLNSQQLASG